MPTYTVKFYDFRPSVNGFTSSGTFVYSGSGNTVGTATITDNEAGIEGLTMDDDSNGAETATADVTVGGNTSIGSNVDAEISWLVRDETTGTTFNVVEFEVENGAASGVYTLSEVKLHPGRTYTVLDYDSNPDVNAGAPVFTYSEFVCFASDTLIATSLGDRPVQSLQIGDMVLTLDNGPQPLIWIASRVLRFGPAPHPQKPIELKASSLGHGLPTQTLKLSPQHRVLLGNNAHQNLGPAKALCNRPRIRQMNGVRQVRYHSLMTAQHEVLFANGVCVESFYPGDQAIRVLSWRQRLQLLAVCPSLLEDGVGAYSPPARTFISRCASIDAPVAPLPVPRTLQDFGTLERPLDAPRLLH